MNPDVVHLALLTSFSSAARLGAFDGEALKRNWRIDETASEFQWLGESSHGRGLGSLPERLNVFWNRALWRKGVRIASKPDDWIDWAVSHPVNGFELCCQPGFGRVVPDRFLMEELAPPERATWFLQLHSADGVEIWTSRRLLSGVSFFAQRWTKTTYLGATADAPISCASISIAEATDRLRATIVAIREFAREQRRGGFGITFDDALISLESDEPERVSVGRPPLARSSRRPLPPEILAPGVYSLGARRLVGAAHLIQYLFSFAGMNSWWDHFEDDAETAGRDRQLVANLLSAADRAIVTGVNEIARTRLRPP